MGIRPDTVRNSNDYIRTKQMFNAIEPMSQIRKDCISNRMLPVGIGGG